MIGSPRSASTTAVIRFALLAALGITLFFVVATTSADVDLWGHIRFGLDNLAALRIDAHDPYAFTSGRPWVNHEWLSEIVFAVVWRAGGTSGLIALKLAIVAGAVLFIWRILLLEGVGSKARLVLTGLTLAGMLPRLIHVRPQLFSVLLFSMLMWVLARARHGRRTTLALCPPMLTLWTNLHGGWITGLGALGLWALDDSWDRRRKGVRALDGAAWTALAAGATLVNPYGVGLWQFLAETVGLGREGIREWGPIWMEPSALIAWIVFALIVVASIRSTGVRPLGTRLLQPLFWGAASLRVLRLDAFFAISVASFLGPAFEQFLRRRARPASEPAPIPLRVRGLVVAILLALAVAIPRARQTVSCIVMFPSLWPEPAAVDFIRANALSGRMITFFDWGEYGIWHLPPSIKISMDGRRETVYSDEMFSMHWRFYAGADTAATAYIDALDADYAWLPVDMPGVQGLLDRGWVEVFRGERSVILAARGRPPAGFVRPPSPAADVTRCFPGP